MWDLPMSTRHCAWIGYCVTWLHKLAKPVNTQCFLLVRPIWEGQGSERMPKLVMQNSVGINPRGMSQNWCRRDIYPVITEFILFGRTILCMCSDPRHCIVQCFVVTMHRNPFPFLPFLFTSGVHRSLLIHIGMEEGGYITSWVGGDCRGRDAL